MSVSKKIEAIRKKPQHVRERYLLGAMAVLIPVMLTIWYSTFKFESSSGTTFVQGILGDLKNTFSNPEYDKTFGNSAITPEPAKKR